MLAEETRKRGVDHRNSVVLGEEMDRMEAKQEAKVEDANEEIARLQQQVKENKETLGTTIGKQGTCGLEVKEREKEIATLRKMVSTLKKEKEVKTIVKEVGVKNQANYYG